MVAEVLEGTLHWALFHPNAVPTVGFREDEGLGGWMRDSYPLVSPLFSPMEVYQHPGEALRAISMPTVVWGQRERDQATPPL